MTEPVRREVHFWSDQLAEPPCGTLEDGYEWSDAVDDVTCAACMEALAADSGELARPGAEEPDEGRPPGP